MIKKGIIYGIRSVVFDRVVYVGQTRQRPKDRWAQHRERNTPLARVLREVGIEKFEFFIVETVDITALNDREQVWIAHFSTMHPTGLNHRPGGRAHGVSAKVKEKLSARSKETWADEGHKKREAERLRSLWLDPDYRAKMAGKRKEMWADPAFREKMREAHRRRWEDKDRRARQTELMKEHWADPEYKERVSKQISEAVSKSPAFLAAQSGRSRQRYAAKG